jgi:hypothetical protein
MTKPVAWMASNELLFSVVKDEIYHIPLYTQRELTDEEILLEPQTDLIVLLREEVTLMQKYLEEQNLREHFVAWRDGK